MSVDGLSEENVLKAGETLQPASVMHKNTVWGTAPLQTNDVTWKSSDENIFKVDENGKITALSQGTATLFVTLLNSTIEYEITVEGILPSFELSLPNVEEVEVGGTVEYILKIYDAQEVNLTKEDITLSGVTADIVIEGTGNEERKIILSNIQGEVGAEGYISCIAEGVAKNDTGNSFEFNIDTDKFTIIASEEPMPLPRVELSLPNIEEVEVGGTVEYTLNIYDAENVNLTEEDITLSGVAADIVIEGTGTEERKIILSNIQGEVGVEGYISCIAEGIATNKTGKSEELNITIGKFSIIEVEAKLYKGDINKDGLVDSADAAIALNIYKYNNATEDNMKMGDMDNNGMIDSADAAIILNYYKYNQKVEI